MTLVQVWAAGIRLLQLLWDSHVYLIVESGRLDTVGKATGLEAH